MSSSTPGESETTDVESGIAEVLGHRLEEFTPARDALARQLLKAGRRDQAARVSALRKPGVHLWAANQLARRRQVAVKRLLATAADLAEAQGEVLSGAGGAGDRLRRDSGEYQRALDQAVREARSLLLEAGRGAGEETMRRVREVLANGAVGAGEGRQKLAAGTLTEEPEAPGFGVFTPGPAPVPRPVSRAIPAKPAAAAPRLPAGGAAVRAASRAEERARRAAEEAAREEERRRRAAMRRELENAEAELRRAEQAARRLRRRAEATSAEARSAGEDAERADRALKEARRAAVDAKSRLG